MGKTVLSRTAARAYAPGLWRLPGQTAASGYLGAFVLDFLLLRFMSWCFGETQNPAVFGLDLPRDGWPQVLLANSLLRCASGPRS
jgi:hypothetical protein